MVKIVFVVRWVVWLSKGGLLEEEVYSWSSRYVNILWDILWVWKVGWMKIFGYVLGICFVLCLVCGWVLKVRVVVCFI